MVDQVVDKSAATSKQNESEKNVSASGENKEKLKMAVREVYDIEKFTASSSTSLDLARLELLFNGIQEKDAELTLKKFLTQKLPGMVLSA